MVSPSRVGQVYFLRSLEVLGEEASSNPKTTSTRDRLSDGDLLSAQPSIRGQETYLSLG